LHIYIEGLIKGGNEGARARMREYWTKMSELSKEISPNHLLPLEAMLRGDDHTMARYNLNNSLGFSMMGQLQSKYSPYEWNAKIKNPFKDFVEGFFDFKTIRTNTEKKVFLGTTHVRTGKVKDVPNLDTAIRILPNTKH
jgi:hypothetical protein